MKSLILSSLTLLLILTTNSLIADHTAQFSRWDGAQWQPYAQGEHGITGSGWFNVFEVDSQGRIFCGGGFLPWEIFEWTGDDWHNCDSIPPMLGRHRPLALCIDSADNVYAGSTYDDTTDANRANWKTLSSVIRWTGSRWLEVGSPLDTEMFRHTTSAADGRISHLCSDAANALYASYTIPSADGSTIQSWHLKRFANGEWTEIPTDALSDLKYPTCLVTDRHNRLYISGAFKSRTRAMGFYRLDGQTWSALGFDASLQPWSDTTYYRGIEALCVDELDQVYVYGYFKNVDSAWYVAKWNGSAWSELGFDHFKNYSFISDLEVYDAHHIYTAGHDLFGGTWFSQCDGLQWTNDWLSTDPTDAKIAIDRYGVVYAASALTTSAVYDLPAAECLSFFPQPCDQACVVRWTRPHTQLSVWMYDVLGAVVSEFTVTPNQSELTIATNDVESGMYIIAAVDSASCTQRTAPIIIQH